MPKLHEPLRYCEFRVGGDLDVCAHWSAGTVHGMHMCVNHAQQVLFAIGAEDVEFVKGLTQVAVKTAQLALGGERLDLLQQVEDPVVEEPA